jgi:hypothetical protein
MRVKANDVGSWLRRQHVGKRDHREALSGDHLVIRPGPNFDWFMGSLAAGQPAPSSLEHGKSSNDHRKAGDRLGQGLPKRSCPSRPTRP